MKGQAKMRYMKFMDYKWLPSLQNGGCSRNTILGMKSRIYPWVPADSPHMGHIHIAYVGPAEHSCELTCIYCRQPGK